MPDTTAMQGGKPARKSKQDSCLQSELVLRLRQESPHLCYRPYDSEVKRVMLKRLSLPGRSIVVLTWTEYRTDMLVQNIVISKHDLHSSCGSVGLRLVLIQQYAAQQLPRLWV